MSLVVQNKTTKKLQSERRHVAEPRYKSGGCASLSGLELLIIVQSAKQQPFGKTRHERRALRPWPRNHVVFFHAFGWDDRAIGPARLQDQALLAAATPLLS